MIYKIEQYTDDEGKLVTARVPLPGTISPTKYFGTYMVPHPQHGQIRIEFEFPEGWDIKKCLDEFKTEAEKDFTRIQVEAQKEAQAQLWTPGAKSNLIVPK